LPSRCSVFLIPVQIVEVILFGRYLTWARLFGGRHGLAWKLTFPSLTAGLAWIRFLVSLLVLVFMIQSHCSTQLVIETIVVLVNRAESAREPRTHGITSTCLTSHCLSPATCGNMSERVSFDATLFTSLTDDRLAMLLPFFPTYPQLVESAQTRQNAAP